MRHLERPGRLIALLLLALASCVANAQSTAQHTVSVHIPTVLRLRIDRGTASDARAVAFTIAGDTVTPDHLDIEVFANSSWTLSVEETGGDGPHLEYEVDGSQAWTTPSRRPVVADGGATGGWLGYALGFRVHGQTFGGDHRRILLFTLSRP